MLNSEAMMFKKSLGIDLLGICACLILGISSLSSAGPWSAHAAGNKQLEVFSWWTSRGEAVALEALFKLYTYKNPGVEILNAAVTGGGGSAARPVLQTRLAAGDPPDTWQVHPGHELLGQYVQGGYCVPVTVLYRSEGWDRVVPQGLIDRVSKDNEIYAVLAGVMSSGTTKRSLRNIRSRSV